MESWEAVKDSLSVPMASAVRWKKDNHSEWASWRNLVNWTDTTRSPLLVVQTAWMWNQEQDNCSKTVQRGQTGGTVKDWMVGMARRDEEENQFERMRGIVG